MEFVSGDFVEIIKQPDHSHVFLKGLQGYVESITTLPLTAVVVALAPDGKCRGVKRLEFNCIRKVQPGAYIFDAYVKYQDNCKKFNAFAFQNNLRDWV